MKLEFASKNCTLEDKRTQLSRNVSIQLRNWSLALAWENCLTFSWEILNDWVSYDGKSLRHQMMNYIYCHSPPPLPRNESNNHENLIKYDFLNGQSSVAGIKRLQPPLHFKCMVLSSICNFSARILIHSKNSLSLSHPWTHNVDSVVRIFH